MSLNVGQYGNDEPEPREPAIRPMTDGSVVEEAFGTLVRGSAFIFVGNVVGMSAGFLARLIAARHLGPSDYGYVVIGLTVMNVLTLIALLGLQHGVARQIPRIEDGPAAFRTAVAVAVPIAVGFAVAVATSADHIASFLSESGLTPVLVAFAVALPFNVVRELAVGGLRGVENARGRVLVNNFVNQGGVALAVFAGSVVGLGTVAVVTGWVSVIALSALTGLVVLWRWTPLVSVRSDRRLTPDLGRAKFLLGFSLPLMLNTALWELLKQSDNFVLGYFLTSGAVGLYDAAFTFAQLLLVIAGTFEFVFLPVFSRLHADGSREEMSQLYHLATKWMVFLTFPAYLFVLFFPEFVLQTSYGSAYVGSALALQIVATGFFCHALAGVAGYSLIAMGYTRPVVWASALALAINLTVNVALIPVLGITGAAVASAAAYAAANGYTRYKLARLGGVPSQYASILPVLLASGAVLVAVFGLARLAFEPTVGRVAVVVGVAGIAYVATLVLSGGVEPEDWAVVADVNDKVPVDLEPLRRFLRE